MNTSHLKILGAAVRNFVAIVTWCPGFVSSLCSIYGVFCAVKIVKYDLANDTLSPGRR